MKLLIDAKESHGKHIGTKQICILVNCIYFLTRRPSKKNLKSTKKKYGLLDLLFSCFITNYDELQKDITQNVAEKITKLRYSVNKTIDELNKIMKYMYDNNYNKYEHIKLNYYPEIKLR